MELENRLLVSLGKSIDNLKNDDLDKATNSVTEEELLDFKTRFILCLDEYSKINKRSTVYSYKVVKYNALSYFGKRGKTDDESIKIGYIYDNNGDLIVDKLHNIIAKKLVIIILFTIIMRQ